MGLVGQRSSASRGKPRVIDEKTDQETSAISGGGFLYFYSKNRSRIHWDNRDSTTETRKVKKWI
jgi:hypothetical protein